MVEYRLTQTGEEVQELLEQVTPNEQAIAKEIEDRTDADTALRTELKNYTDAETSRAQGIEESLQQQINDIVSGDATISLSASPTAIFTGVESTVNLTASTNKSATEIVIKKAGTTIATGSGSSKSTTDTVTPDAVGQIAYSAEFTISGNKRTANRNVNVVLPLYYGVGTEYPSEMTKDNTPRVAGSFNYANIATVAGDFLYFEIPNNMKLTALELVSTYNTPLSFEDINSQREGYKAYKNSEPRGEGTYTYKLTIAND